MSEHTREPWKVWTSNSNIRISAGGKDGAVVSAYKAADGVPVLAITPEDARRIVACVNACKGYSTEDLEQFGRFISTAESIDDKARGTEHD